MRLAQTAAWAADGLYERPTMFVEVRWQTQRLWQRATGIEMPTATEPYRPRRPSVAVDPMRATRRWERAAVAAAALTVATVVVAMAARAPLSRSTPVDAASARAPVTALLMLVLGGGIVALAMLAVVTWASRRRNDEDGPERLPEPLPVLRIWNLLAILLRVALGAALVAAAVMGAQPLQRAPRPTGGRLSRSLSAPAAPRPTGHGFAVPLWLPWTVLAIVVVAIAVAGVWLLVRRGGLSVDRPSEQSAAHAAVDAAIGALDTGTDARTGVIAAYVAMQGTLAAHGVARAPSEARFARNSRLGGQDETAHGDRAGCPRRRRGRRVRGAAA